MDAVIFDMDGVLVDTKEANRMAYEAVGVTMPENAFGKPWTDWLIDAVGNNLDEADLRHRAKTDAYGAMIPYINTLPPASLMDGLMSTGKVFVGIVTGAARTTAEAILEQRLQLGPKTLLGTGCTVDEKRHIIFNLPYDRVVYIDDMKPSLEWYRQPQRIKYLQYVGQTYEQLLNEMERLWTP